MLFESGVKRNTWIAVPNLELQSKCGIYCFSALAFGRYCLLLQMIILFFMLTVWFIIIIIGNCFDLSCGLLAVISYTIQYQYPSWCFFSFKITFFYSILGASNVQQQWRPKRAAGWYLYTAARNRPWSEHYYLAHDWSEVEIVDGTDRLKPLYHHNSNKGAGCTYVPKIAKIFYKQSNRLCAPGRPVHHLHRINL